MAGYVECPKCGVLYKGEHVCEGKATQTSSTTEEERALTSMLNQLPILHYEMEADIFKAALYAGKTTIKDPTERRVFIQDFAASLNRKGILHSPVVEKFCEFGYVYMEAK